MVVMAASEDEGAEGALQELCEAYWPPLYAFARRSGCDPEEAQDMTQEFVAQMLERGLLDKVDRERGKFRTYLLRCMKNMLTNEWRKATRKKRGGGAAVFSLDEHDPERGYRAEPGAEDIAPDTLFDRRWAETLVDRSMSRLRSEWDAQGKPFDVLKTYLVDPRGERPFSHVASELGTSESALKTSVHRLRRRYGEVFRDEVAHTVAEPAEVEGEIRYLLSVLGG
jgi:RNA polymerase sigma-70 factor (ECF subfamily)